MNNARSAFRQIDATGLDKHDEYTFHISDRTLADDEGMVMTGEDDAVTSLTVEFEEYEAESKEKLEELLDEEAERVLDESEATAEREPVGYELTRVAGDTSRKVGFVVTAPHL